MTDDDKKKMLEHLTGETDQTVLSTYLLLAQGKVLTHLYPYGDGTETVPTAYETTLIEIAAFMLNKRGAEGETSHSENGVSRSYDDSDIPPYLLHRLVPQAGVL